LPEPPKPFEGRNVHAWRLAVAAGAILGGLLVGAFDNRPGWLWGMGGGLAGGVIAWLSWRLSTSSVPTAVRALLVMLVAGAGFFLIWFVAGRAWVLDFTVRTGD
jgi:hypothetical protein